MGALTRLSRLTASGSSLSKMLMDVNDATNEISSIFVQMAASLTTMQR